MVAVFSSSCNPAPADVTDTPDVFPPRNCNGRRIFEQDTLPGSFLRGLAMGLDLALGVIILLWAFRGWFKGFVNQAVRLTSLVVAVYAAVRVRDYAKPYIIPHLTTMKPDLVDQILWWVSMVLTYIVLVAVASLVVKMTRRPEIPGISQAGHNDQFAGFFLGALKGLVAASFLTAGIQNYGLERVKNVSWADEQAKASRALEWNETYQPARKIWAWKPVRHFCNHFQRMGFPGLIDEGETRGDGPDAEGLVRTASRPAEAEGTSDNERGSESSSRAGTSSSSAAPPAEAPQPTTD
jgi:membrane protein required for colicin V production